MVLAKFDNDVAKSSVAWRCTCVDEADYDWKVWRIPISICGFLKFCASQFFKRLNIILFGCCVDLPYNLVRVVQLSSSRTCLSVSDTITGSKLRFCVPWHAIPYRRHS
jgi:hypothetical protein